MIVEICVPALGESVAEAIVGKWLKNPGDPVVADEPLVELETDKVAVEVPAPSSGVLSEILVHSGEAVQRGACLGRIDSSAVVSSALLALKSASLSAAGEGSSMKKPDSVPSPISPSLPLLPPSPSALRLMQENGITPDEVKGSGKRGQILKHDVSGVSSPASSPGLAHEQRVPMSKLRQTIARRLKDAQNTAAILTTFNEVNMQPVMDLRSRYREAFEKKHGVKLGFMGLFTQAVISALAEIPVLNAQIDGTDIVFSQDAHIAVAVSTENGLVVPVVRHANQMSVADIEKEIVRLGLAARKRQLSVADMQGGTFTISNGGVYGSLLSTPILNMPQSGILGMHKIQERPVVVDGAIVIRSMMYLALSYDHRIVDGKDAVQFLVHIKEILEDPARMVLGL